MLWLVSHWTGTAGDKLEREKTPVMLVCLYTVCKKLQYFLKIPASGKCLF